jgi:alanine dehydrogenase
VRAGSPSGLGTKWLARPDCRTACCIGSGEIMEQAITSVCGARPIESVKVYSPTPDHRTSFASMMTHKLGIPFTAVDAAEEAVRGADVVQIVTNSHFEPVIDGAWLEPGQHVNSIAPGEIDEETILRSSLFVGTRERTLHDNPPRQPLAGMLDRGVITVDYVQAELGEVIIGAHPGRKSADEITLFLSPGVGFYDVAVATWVYRTARAHGLGLELE